jgi:hypothetical protein
MQDLPLDAANYYWAREGWWGLFDNYGRPTKNYHAMLAFSELLAFPIRAGTRGNDPCDGVGVCAAFSPAETSAAVLLTNLKCPQATFEVGLNHLPWSETTICEVHRVDDTHDFSAESPIVLAAEQKSIRLSIPPATVCLLKMMPHKA